MTTYDATGICRNLRCTVLRYAFDTSGRSEAPECPACEQRDRADTLAARLAAVEREAKAEAWDEGFDAGHQAARAVNPEWPEQPTNPYRAALATGTTTNQEADQ